MTDKQLPQVRPFAEAIDRIFDASAEYHDAMTKAQEARELLKDAVIAGVLPGAVSEVQAAKMAQISRETVRRWLGK